MLALGSAEAHRSVQAIDSCSLIALRDEGMILSLRLICESAASIYQVRLDLLETVKQRFDEEGISIAHEATTIDLRAAQSD